MASAFETDLLASIPRLRRFAYSLTGSLEEGDELVQAACERALQNASKFRPGTRMDSWLFRIVQNLWLDDRRRTSSRGVAVDPDAAGLSDGGLSARHAEDRMMLQRVREAIVKLPKEQRLVLVLVTVEGLSYRQVAEMLETPIGTVMSRLSRARLQLAALLDEPRVQ